MSSSLADEPLSAALLQQELYRLKRRQVVAQTNSGADQRVIHLCKAISTSSEKLLSSGDAITSREALDAYMAASSDVLATMLRLTQLIFAFRERTGGNDGKDERAEQSSALEALAAPTQSVVSQCMEEWTLWITHVPRLPHYCASYVAVRLLAILSNLHQHTDFQLSAYFFASAYNVTKQLLLSASQTFSAEVRERCLPLRSLQPPWTALRTCAQYAWAWERLGALDDTHNASGTARRAPQRDVGDEEMVTFEATQDLLEREHASQLTRDVLLFSFDTVNWKVGSAVPTVKSVAPAMWCLFLRCRSLALHDADTVAPQDNNYTVYFDRRVARRLIARVLQRAIDGVRDCLARNATDMHVVRVEQLTARDIPCLVLLTRLWYLYLQPCAALLTALHGSLVRMVNTAVELRNPLTVDESITVVGADAEKPCAVHERDEEEEAAAVKESARAHIFLTVVWNIEPLQEHEIAASSAGMPWSSSFPRAAAISAVVDERVMVTTVE